MEGVKIGGTSCFGSHLHSLPSSPPSSPHTFPSSFTPKIMYCISCPHRSPFLSRTSSLGRARGGSKQQVLRRASGAASLAGGGGDDFFWPLDELASHFSPARDAEHPWNAVRPEPPNWLPDPDGIVPACIGMRASGAHLMPVSLRMLKREEEESKQGTAGEPACSSVNRAFSSMVFIVRELHSFALQMREALSYESLEVILAGVQEEMNASFVWLFQHIFSCTPSLMVSLMLLLANFAVCSLSHSSSAFAASSSPPPPAHSLAAANHDHGQQDMGFDAPQVKSSSAGSRTASVDGSGGGGASVKPVAGPTGDGGRASSHLGRPIVRGPGELTAEEAAAWDGIVEEASRMKAGSRNESLMEPETRRLLVAPVSVRLEQEECSIRCLQTELTYHEALSQDPDNAMLISNFAQFIFLVLHDLDRAECYFKRATGVKPADAEALNRYANFMWVARNDLGAAEEAYLDAIAADPSNSYYAASYAHFLWNTGGEDTCYPLDAGDDT